MTLRAFIRESNRIEGILDEPTNEEVRAHQSILTAEQITLAHLCAFVEVITEGEGKLRDKAGMNVRVGSHRPPDSGPEIRKVLIEDFLPSINQPGLTPWRAHVRYETLHPFTDGNGRSGRVIWAWMMQREGRDPFALGFLRAAYYQALDGSRA